MILRLFLILLPSAISAQTQSGLDVKTKYGWIRFSETRVEKSPIAANIVFAGKIKNNGFWFIDSVKLQLSCPDGFVQAVSFLYIWDGEERPFRLSTQASAPRLLDGCVWTVESIAAKNAVEQAKDVIRKRDETALEALVKANPKMAMMAFAELKTKPGMGDGQSQIGSWLVNGSKNTASFSSLSGVIRFEYDIEGTPPDTAMLQNSRSQRFRPPRHLNRAADE